MKIYLSGKITGTDDYKEKFEKVSQELQIKYPNSEIINPVELCKDIPCNSNWSEYMKCCIQGLIQCDTIYMTADWQFSKGSRLEHRIAENLELEIIY